MNIERIVTELKEERDRLDNAIAVLGSMGDATPRRGRPPAWLSALNSKGTGKTKGKTQNASKGVRTDAARRSQSAKMKAYWETRRKNEAKEARKAKKEAKLKVLAAETQHTPTSHANHATSELAEA